MLKIFLSSTYQDLGEARSEILKKLDSAFAGVGMEEFIPDGKSSHEICINELKKSDIIIFLLSSNYGSLIEVCKLKENCKAECPMKTGEGRISYTHCEYKTTIAEGILHQTYKVLKGWDTQDKEEASQFVVEFGNEMWTGIDDIEDSKVVPLICNNLAEKIVEWHTHDKLNFKKFIDREEVLNEIIDNIDSKVEVWGVGGVGKTALVEVALLVEKLKGRKILTIGTSKSYKSGSGFKDFRKKCVDDQYITESQKEITLYDVVKALEKVQLIPNAEQLISSLQKKTKIIIFLSKFLSENRNLIVFIDDFHLATKDVKDLVDFLKRIILSSREKYYIAGKEILITGIDEEDREDLINLFSAEDIPQKAKEIIKTIAEGHPVATELLVKNYGKIDFDKIKDFDLTDADDKQVKNFYERVIEEIFSSKPQVLTLLKDIAVLNTDLPTNINQESVLNAYSIENVRTSFNSLVDIGMLRKKDGEEGIFEFYFKHIQDVLEDSAAQESHEKALEYYNKKRDLFEENIDDEVEMLYHKVKSNLHKESVKELSRMIKKVQPIHHGFYRLIFVGEELITLVEEENKAHVLWDLGSLYFDLKRFEEAEPVYMEAVKIFKELVSKSPKAYNSSFAYVQNSLGSLYWELKRFKEAEEIYKEALEIFMELAGKSPGTYNLGVAYVQNNLGLLYKDLGRLMEAEHAYKEALEIKKHLADKNPDVYNPDLANTQYNLGLLYWNLKKYKKAVSAYNEALEIRKRLVVKNPDRYNSELADTQNNLGVSYRSLGRLKEAEHAYKEAIEIKKHLTDKNPDVYNPDLANTHYNLGNLYKNLGRLEEAESAYNEALEIRIKLVVKNPDRYNPKLADTQINLGNLYKYLGRFEEAESAYQEALETHSRDSVTWYNKACLESLRNLRDKAVEYLKRAIDLDNKYIDIAKSEKDFDTIRNSKEFKELIGE